MRMASPDDIDLQLLAENVAHMICKVDLDNTLRYVSPSCLHLLGWTPQEMVGLCPGKFFFAEDLPAMDNAVTCGPSASNKDVKATVRMLKKDQSPAWMEMSGHVVRDGGTGEPTEFLMVLRDVNERKFPGGRPSAKVSPFDLQD